MPDTKFDDGYLATLYDRLSVDRGDEAFYLELITAARRALDVGCGTGTLLHRARGAGHRGRLVGLDPADAMLALARRHRDVEWVRGTLPEAGFDAEFDLIVMTGHAFQVLLGDDDVRAFFAAAHRALAPHGRLAFETRNPLHRAWERWTPDDLVEVTDEAGRTVRVWHELERVDGEYVTFAEFYARDDWPEPLGGRSTLRFLPAERLDHLLAAAGFVVDERYGLWDRRPFTPETTENTQSTESPEIITVARAVEPSQT